MIHISALELGNVKSCIIMVAVIQQLSTEVRNMNWRALLMKATSHQAEAILLAVSDTYHGPLQLELGVYQWLNYIFEVFIKFPPIFSLINWKN